MSRKDDQQKHGGCVPVPVSLSDYKSDQDKFFERKRQVEEFIEAAEKEQQQKHKSKIDKVAEVLVSCDSFGSEVEARAEVIRGGPRNSDSWLRWDPDPGEGVWHATEETELPC